MSNPPNYLGRALGLLVAAACALGLFSFTSHKLQKMRMIRGEIAGARFIEGKISRKWETPGKYGKPVHWLLITYVDDGGQRSHRDNVEEEKWNALRPGEVLALAILPDGSVELRGGIYASDGNMVFDRILQGVELLGAVLFGAAAVACVVLALRRGRNSS